MNGGSMRDKIQGLIDGNALVVMGTSTCPFCLEAKRTLNAYGITGLFVDMDKEEDASEMRQAMSALAGSRTSVPQIWIKKTHVGGCDDLKALDASGDLRLELQGLPRHAHFSDAEDGATVHPVTGDASGSAAVITYPGPDAAFFAPFHSPHTVDHRVVRVNGVITFFIAVLTCVFAGRMVTEWVVLGLLVDFALKLTGFPSPIGLLAALPFAGTMPHLSPGVPKQFANLCGIFFASVAWACLVGDKSIGARIMLVGGLALPFPAMLAGAAFLQGFMDFCAGCLIFEYLLKWGLISKSVYRLYINTRADTVYAWEKFNTPMGNEVSPAAVTYPTQGLPLNPTDLCAKPGKEDEKWERFHLVKYCHVSYFMVPLSVLGLALPWAMLAETVGTSDLVWQVLAWAGVFLQVILLNLYLMKRTLHATKVSKEWSHPLHRNSFALPFLNFILMSWLATKWSGGDGGDLARVLYWLGSAPLAAMTLYMVASWIAIPQDEEFVTPSWMLMPVGNLVGAVAARPVDSEYVEWGWFLFGTGVLLWLALWPITFRRAISDHHSDFRLRNLYGVWVAPPAVAMIAYSSLEELDSLDAVQRLLFYASLALALVLAPCCWPLNFFLEEKFDMSVWAFAFPLDALAAAAVIVYRYTLFDIMQVIYVVALTAACLVNMVCALSTLASLKAKSIFSPAGKWSPLSFMKLTHEAFREAFPKLEKMAAAAKPEPADASSLRDFATAWSSMSTAHDIHSRHEDKVMFPVLEGYFPGQTSTVATEHEEHEALMRKVQAAIDSLVSGEDGADCSNRTALLDGLRTDLKKFCNEALQHMDHEEHAFATPVARKYLPLSIAKELARKSWDVTKNSEMSDFLGWMMAYLRTRGQRTRFLRTWVWAMPECAQQLGLMVYRVVDDVTWVEVVRDLPEVVPRGLPGYRRYF